MLKIGEFSKLVRVSARMLRYYEKCGLLVLAETDCFTGYRIYSAAQISILSRIVQLRDMGFGVEEINDLLPNFKDASIMQEALEKKSIEIRTVISNEQGKLEKIAAMCGTLKKECVNMVFEFELKELKAQNVISLREKIPAYDKEGELWEKLGKFMAENNIACESGGYSIYYDEDYKETDIDIEIAVPVQSFGKSKGDFIFKELEPIPTAATVRFSGPYEGYNEAIGKLAAWIEKNGYEMDGLIRGLAIAAPGDVSSPEDYMTELQVPVKKYNI